MLATRPEELFAKRFEPNGEGYIYRPNLRAPGVLVTATERDRFVANFNRGFNIATWSIAGLCLVAVTIVFFATWPGRVPLYVIFLIVGGCVPVVVGANHWLWGAPNRALVGRTPVVEGRSKAEATKLAWQRLTWGRLGLSLLVVPILLLRVGNRNNLLVGWNRLWLVLAGAFLVLVAVQAFRKWRAGHRDQ